MHSGIWQSLTRNRRLIPGGLGDRHPHASALTGRTELSFETRRLEWLTLYEAARALRCDYSAVLLAPRATDPTPLSPSPKGFQIGRLVTPLFAQTGGQAESVSKEQALHFCTGVKKGSRELDSSATHWPRDIVILFLSDASHGRGLQ
jgi:hypothetical protein